MGIMSPNQLQQHIENTIKNADRVLTIDGKRPRTAFYHRGSNTLVIVDEGRSDLGTVCPPTDGERYLDETLIGKQGWRE